MSSKRTRDEDAAPDAGASPAPKKAKHGFRVGPENLPDGPWRRKVTKIKKELITKAKVKKQYAKVKAEHQKQAATTEPQDPTTQTAAAAEDGETTNQPAPEPAQLHPERQAMLDSTTHPDANPNNDDTGPTSEHQQPRQRRPRKQQQQRPDYYTKELAAASHAKQQAEERAAEFARRDQERQQRVAERERYRRAMDKAKTPGRDGKVKVGKESRLLLERVQRMMGGGK